MRLRALRNRIAVQPHHLLFVGWLIALGATLGALFIGEVMGQRPCLLCWYQRIAMFPLVLILGAGFINNDTRVQYYALPLTLLGAAVAAWHSLLYVGWIPASVEPCTRDGPSCSDASMTLFGLLPIPLLSTVAFIAIGVCVAIAHRKAPHG